MCIVLPLLRALSCAPQPPPPEESFCPLPPQPPRPHRPQQCPQHCITAGPGPHHHCSSPAALGCGCGGCQCCHSAAGDCAGGAAGCRCLAVCCTRQRTGGKGVLALGCLAVLGGRGRGAYIGIAVGCRRLAVCYQLNTQSHHPPLSPLSPMHPPPPLHPPPRLVCCRHVSSTPRSSRSCCSSVCQPYRRCWLLHGHWSGL